MSAGRKNGQDRHQQIAPDSQIYRILERMSRRWGQMAETRLEDMASFLEYVPKSKISRAEEERIHFIEGNLTQFLAFDLSREDARLQGKDFEHFANICFASVSRQDGNRWFEHMALFLRLHEIILHEERMGIWTSTNRLAFSRKCRAGKNQIKNAKRMFPDYVAQYVQRHCAKLEGMGFLKADRDRGKGRNVSYFHGPNLWTDPYHWLEVKKSLMKTHLEHTRTEKAVSLVGTFSLAALQEEHNIIVSLNKEARQLRDRWLLADLSERLPPTEKKDASDRDLTAREVQAIIKTRMNHALEALNGAIAKTVSESFERIDQLTPRDQEKLDAAVRMRIDNMRNEFRRKLPDFDPPVSLPDLPLIVIDLNSLAFEKL
jgi:hypothetical protein